jgi:chromate transporter
MDRPRPASASHLFWAMTVLALQGFGGVLAVVQRELVEKRRWLSKQEFIEDWAVAQILPGPNVVNLSLMIGARHFGWRGAVAALGGMLVFPLLVVLVMAAAFASVADHPSAQAALRGMGAVAAGLVTATGIKLIGALKGHPLGLAACAGLALVVFVTIALWRWPLAAVLLGLGSVACVWTYVQLGRLERAKADQG